MVTVISVSVIFDTVATYSCYSNKVDFVKLEEKTPPINIKGIEKFLEIYGFGIVKYSVRSESGCLIALRYQAYYVPGLPKYLRIISPQGIHTSEGYKRIFMAHFHDDHDSYAELNLKEENPGCQKVKPVERVYVKYDPNNKLPTHEANLPNKREKEVKAS